MRTLIGIRLPVSNLPASKEGVGAERGLGRRVKKGGGVAEDECLLLSPHTQRNLETFQGFVHCGIWQRDTEPTMC